MKLNKLETHDRYKHFVKQDFSIAECCQDIINKRPFGDHPFYIFAHARTEEDGVTKRIIWQPRLTKPAAQPNSMLFKAYPGSDNIKICWMIPDALLWSQFRKGNVTENSLAVWSINMFQFHKKKLEAKEEDDLPDDQVDAIYRQFSRAGNKTGYIKV
jgi:hypothetical protein